jgi:hypothetical protein
MLMNRSFLPGETIDARMTGLFGEPDKRQEKMASASDRLNHFFADIVPRIRSVFSGRITYAAVPTERVDWELFDIVALELIRTDQIADGFEQTVARIVKQYDKPVAMTGFGTATWAGSGARAARSMEALECDDSGTPVRVRAGYDRDEPGQARYLSEVLAAFDRAGVDSAFVFLFALYNLPHRPDGDPRDDLDRGSLGIVKVYEDRRGETYPDLPWEPKLAFSAVKDSYAG